MKAIPTDEQRKYYLEEIENDRRKGISIVESTKRLGVHESSYYVWKRKFKGTQPKRPYVKRAKPSLLSIPVAPVSDTVVIIVLKPNQLKEVLGNL